MVDVFYVMGKVGHRMLEIEKMVIKARWMRVRDKDGDGASARSGTCSGTYVCRAEALPSRI